MSFLRMNEIDLSGKTVLIRQDLNVPINNDGDISNDARIQASLPTIKMAIEKGASVIICSHLGRPTEGQYEAKYSLAPIAAYLSNALDQPVSLISDYLEQPVDIKKGQVALLENIRFNKGEKADDAVLSTIYANLCDVFIMDAFGTSHRAHASTHGVIKVANEQGKRVCAGPLLSSELDALGKALKTPATPMLAIVGGSKVSTKLEVLTSLAKICDQLIVGGGIANTFIAAKGYEVGASLYEADLLETAKKIMNQTQVLLPEYVVVAKKSEINFDNFLGSLESAEAIIKSVSDIAKDDMILDIAPPSAIELAKAINVAKTILWNGPVGVFEVDKFGEGTKIISEAIKASEGFSIAGGGDTLAAIYKYNIMSDVGYISTGGGAFLEFVEGKELPAVKALQV